MFRSQWHGPAVSEDILLARVTQCQTAAFHGKITYNVGETDAETCISHRWSCTKRGSLCQIPSSDKGLTRAPYQSK